MEKELDDALKKQKHLRRHPPANPLALQDVVRKYTRDVQKAREKVLAAALAANQWQAVMNNQANNQPRLYKFTGARYSGTLLRQPEMDSRLAKGFWNVERGKMMYLHKTEEGWSVKFGNFAGNTGGLRRK